MKNIPTSKIWISWYKKFSYSFVSINIWKMQAKVHIYISYHKILVKMWTRNKNTIGSFLLSFLFALNMSPNHRKVVKLLYRRKFQYTRWVESQSYLNDWESVILCSVIQSWLQQSALPKRFVTETDGWLSSNRGYSWRRFWWASFKQEASTTIWPRCTWRRSKTPSISAVKNHLAPMRFSFTCSSLSLNSFVLFIFHSFNKTVMHWVWTLIQKPKDLLNWWSCPSFSLGAPSHNCHNGFKLI